MGVSRFIDHFGKDPKLPVSVFNITHTQNVYNWIQMLNAYLYDLIKYVSLENK